MKCYSQPDIEYCILGMAFHKDQRPFQNPDERTVEQFSWKINFTYVYISKA